MTHEPIVLVWGPADAVRIADVPDVRYCPAQRETTDEALHNVSSALDDIPPDARERGLAPPTDRRPLARAS